MTDSRVTSSSSKKREKNMELTPVSSPHPKPPSARVAFDGKARDRADASNSLVPVSAAKPKTEKNPFKMPNDSEIFLLREKEKKAREQEREQFKKMRVHEKAMFRSSKNCPPKNIESLLAEDGFEEQPASAKQDLSLKEDPSWTISVTSNRNVEREKLNEYINKKREMFLVQYSLGVKKDEMRKLEEIAAEEERRLERAEKALENDAALFDEFLKQSDKRSVDAIKKAEEETRAKMEKVLDIKKINAQIMLIRSEISKAEELLKEYKLYKQFLESIAPEEWRHNASEKRRARLEAKGKLPQRNEDGRDSASDVHKTADRRMSRASVASQRKTPKGDHPDRSKSRASVDTGINEDTSIRDDESVMTDDSDDEFELFFTESRQLLDLFSELEEQNLSLIQNSQETEEALEELKRANKQTKTRMEHETEQLKNQIDQLQQSIDGEQRKAKDFEIKARMFNFGEFKAEDQEAMLHELNIKVLQVYKETIGDNEANINTLQMLTAIENRLEELFESLEQMPRERVQAAERSKEKERRIKQREEKILLQKRQQEERLKKALERARAAPKRHFGRKLMFRSEPPVDIRRGDDNADQANKEEEELAYFFT